MVGILGGTSERRQQGGLAPSAMHWCVYDAKPYVPLRHKAFSVISSLISCSPLTDKQVHFGRVVLICFYIVGCFSKHILQASSLDRVVCHSVISRRAPTHRIRIAECEHAGFFPHRALSMWTQTVSCGGAGASPTGVFLCTALLA